MKLTVEQLQAHLAPRGGLLRHGRHSDCSATAGCVVEELRLALNIDQIPDMVSNDPADICPDWRGLSDSWPDTPDGDLARTETMLPIMAATSDWREWSKERRRAFASRLVIGVVREIIVDLPDLPPEIRGQCRSVMTLKDAALASRAARAAWAAEAAARAAARATSSNPDPRTVLARLVVEAAAATETES